MLDPNQRLLDYDQPDTDENYEPLDAEENELNLHQDQQEENPDQGDGAYHDDQNLVIDQNQVIADPNIAIAQVPGVADLDQNPVAQIPPPANPIQNIAAPVGTRTVHMAEDRTLLPEPFRGLPTRTRLNFGVV